MEHLEIVTPPTDEPLSLADAKAYLRVDIDDDDDLITGLIVAARMHVEVLSRQTILTTVYDWFTDNFPASANGYYNRLNRLMGPNPQWLPNGAAILYLPKPPLVSVASVKYTDATGAQQTYDPTRYVVSTGIGSRVQPIVGNVWPVIRPQIDGVVVRYTSGYASAAAVPAPIIVAIKMLVAHWYEHREAVAAEGYARIPDTIDALLSSVDHGSYA